MKKIVFLCMVLLQILFSTAAYAQDTEDSISDFEQIWAVSFFINHTTGIFSRHNLPDRYTTDNPLDIGLGIRYKNISAQMSVLLPFTGLLNNGASYDFEMDSYFDKVYFRVYSKRYPNLYDQSTIEENILDIHSSGIMAGFVHNHENHSLSSVIKLDKKQHISSGSILYGFGVFHSSIHSTTETIKRYNDRQHFVYFGPSIGYSYTWVFQNDFFLNLGFNHFSNIAVNINSGNLLYVPKIQPVIVFGHHSDTWSANITVLSYSAFIIWGRNDYDILTLASATIVFSKRF